EAAASAEGESVCETGLGRLMPGDRLTVRVQVPLPGRVALVHAAGDEEKAELDLLFPLSEAEDAPRRALEMVEVAGEVHQVAGAAEQSLLVIWVPEMLPSGWVLHMLARRRLLPESRVWRYVYSV